MGRRQSQEGVLTNHHQETRTKDGNMKIKTGWAHPLDLTDKNSRMDEESTKATKI